MPNGPGCLPRLSRPTVTSWRSPRPAIRVRVSPQACADCLVPQDLMRGILGQAFGVPTDAIDLTYPSTSQEER